LTSNDLVLKYLQKGQKDKNQSFTETVNNTGSGDSQAKTSESEGIEFTSQHTNTSARSTTANVDNATKNHPPLSSDHTTVQPLTPRRRSSSSSMFNFQAGNDPRNASVTSTAEVVAIRRSRSKNDLPSQTSHSPNFLSDSSDTEIHDKRRKKSKIHGNLEDNPDVDFRHFLAGHPGPQAAPSSGRLANEQSAELQLESLENPRGYTLAHFETPPTSPSLHRPSNRQSRPNINTATIQRTSQDSSMSPHRSHPSRSREYEDIGEELATLRVDSPDEDGEGGSEEGEDGDATGYEGDEEDDWDGSDEDDSDEEGDGEGDGNGDSDLGGGARE
jgi:hypothetical protein